MVAAFWHVLWIAGVVVSVSGIVGLTLYATYYRRLARVRYEHGSIILTSNTSFSKWGALLGNEVLATALLDWLLHHAEAISIQGKSYRMKNRLATGKKATASKPANSEGEQ